MSSPKLVIRYLCRILHKCKITNCLQKNPYKQSSPLELIISSSMFNNGLSLVPWPDLHVVVLHSFLLFFLLSHLSLTYKISWNMDWLLLLSRIFKLDFNIRGLRDELAMVLPSYVAKLHAIDRDELNIYKDTLTLKSIKKK